MRVSRDGFRRWFWGCLLLLVWTVSGCTIRSTKVEGSHVQLSVPDQQVMLSCKGGKYQSLVAKLDGKELAELLTSVFSLYAFRFVGGQLQASLQASLQAGMQGVQGRLSSPWMDVSLGLGGQGPLPDVKVGGRSLPYDVDRVCRRVTERLLDKLALAPAPID